MNNKESLYRKIWVVALPIIFQNIIDASVNSADVLMLNYVGQDAISAVSLANSLVGILFMLLISTYYIMGTAVNTCLIAGIYCSSHDVVGAD